MDAQHAAALDRAISPDRLGTYLREADGDQQLARTLYVWDRDLAADIAIVEVALRNCMNDALASRHGVTWYMVDIGLDTRSRDQLTNAWNRVPKKRRTPGHVIAQLMLGFWVNLLDAGGVLGREPQAFKMDYEELWRDCLSSAFPGGRLEARAQQARFTRSWTHEIASTVLAVRNRCAHHEPLLRGIPLPRQDRRISVIDAHENDVRLLRMIDNHLASWVQANSTVPSIHMNRPSPEDR